MAQYTKNPEVVEAVRWNKSGDHDDISSLSVSTAKGKELCNSCGKPWSAHGMRELGHDMHDTVCPGKWVITHEDGRIEYMDDAAFQARYTVVK